MPERRLLIVSYLFPPCGGIGVQRALSLAKYLPRHGWRVEVLRARNAAAPIMDPDLLARVPDGVSVHAAFTPELPFGLRQKLWSGLSGAAAGRAANGHWRGLRAAATWLAGKLLSPEPEIVWTPFAFLAAARLIRRRRIEAVLITVPPFSALLIGVWLKRFFPRLRVIGDFRDEWLRFYLRDFEFQGGGCGRRRAESIERAAVAASDLVVAVTASSLAEIRSRYPSEPEKKFLCIPNGFDPESFAGFTPRPRGARKVVITHAGTVYRTASPRYFLEALDTLPAALRESIEIRFIGRIAASEREYLEGRDGQARLLGVVSHFEALRRMEETDYLLLTMTDRISLPGKLFEYLATGKPVLAISPPGGEVDCLLRETGAGWCAAPDDRPAVAALIERACRRVRDGAPALPVNRDAVRRFERPRLAGEYARALDALLGGG